MYVGDDQPRSYGAVCICKEFEEVMINQIRLLAYEIFQRNVNPDEVHNWHRAERMLISYLLAKAGPLQWLRDEIQTLRQNQREPDNDAERLRAQITRLEEQLQERDSRISRLVAAFQERCERTGSKRGSHGLAEAILRRESGAPERESWQKDMEALLLKQRQELTSQTEQLAASESRYRESEVLTQTQHSELEARSQQLILRDENLKQLESAFQVQHTELQASLQQLERRTKREKDLLELEAAGHAQRVGLQAKSKELEAELTSKSAEMEVLMAQLQERDAQLQQHEASIADRESRVRGLEEQLGAKARSSDGPQSAQKQPKDLSEVIERLHTLQAEVSEKNMKLAKATRQVARLEERLEWARQASEDKDQAAPAAQATQPEDSQGHADNLQKALDIIVEVQQSQVQAGEAALQAAQKETKVSQARPIEQAREYPEQVLSQMHRNRMGTLQSSMPSRMTPSRPAATPLAALAGRMTPVKVPSRDSGPLQAPPMQVQKAPAPLVDTKTEASHLQAQVGGGASSSTLSSVVESIPAPAKAAPTKVIYTSAPPSRTTWTSAPPSVSISRQESSASAVPSQVLATVGTPSKAIQEAIEILSKSAGSGTVATTASAGTVTTIQEMPGGGTLNILGLPGKATQLSPAHLDEIKDRVRRARQQRYVVSPPAALRVVTYGY